MTDEPEVPAEEIVIADEEELKKAIAEHDVKVDREVRRLSRRGFVVAGVATVAAYGAWKWLHLASREGGCAVGRCAADSGRPMSRWPRRTSARRG